MELCDREELSWQGRQTRDLPFQGVEMRERPNGTGGTVLEFNGYASVTNTPYEMHDMLGAYNETVRSGAFAKTIADGCDTAFLSNHGGLTMARTKSGTLRLSEDARGLHTNADLDPSRSDVADMRSAIERGDVSQMSFAFRVIRQEWNEDYDDRSINEVSLDRGDVSVVNYGASAHTEGISLRKLLDFTDDELAEVRADPRFATLASRLILPAVSIDVTEDAGIAENAQPNERNLDFYRARAFALSLRS